MAASVDSRSAKSAKPIPAQGSKMNIYKLLAGVTCTCLIVGGAPWLFVHLGWMSPITDKMFLIVIATGGGLMAKHLVADWVSGEFLFYKYGHDNSIMTFGAALTAATLQMTASTDLFPALKSFTPLGFVSAAVSDDLRARTVQLFLLFGAALLLTLLSAAISAAIKKDEAKGRGILALLNSVLGVVGLGGYMLLLVAKG